MKKIVSILPGLAVVGVCFCVLDNGTTWARDEESATGSGTDGEILSMMKVPTLGAVQRPRQEPRLNSARQAARRYSEGQVELFQRLQANPKMSPAEVAGLKRSLVDERRAAISKALEEAGTKFFKDAGFQPNPGNVDFSHGQAMTTEEAKRQARADGDGDNDSDDAGSLQSGQPSPKAKPKPWNLSDGATPVHGGTARTPAQDSGPSQPEVVLDGSNVPKEIHYEKKAKPVATPDKKSLLQNQ